MRALLAVSCAGALISALPAQIANLVGFTHGFHVTYTDRLGGNAIEVDCLQHFNSRDYRNWCLNPADPTGNTARIVGFRIQMQDQMNTTPETYTLVGYREDPTNPNNPDVNPSGSGMWFRTGAIPFPTGSVGATILFGMNPPAIPLSHDPNRDDLFLGAGLNAGTWPTDGLGVLITHALQTGATPAAPFRDVPGPRAADVFNSPTPNFIVQVQTALGLPTGSIPTWPAGTGGGLSQIGLDILLQATGGVSVTQTNQTNYPVSLPTATPTGTVPLGGTTNMLSGLNPDLNNAFGATPARADDIGFLLNERNRPNSLCAVIVGFGSPSFGINLDGSFPLPFLFSSPNTRGLLCVEPGSPSTIFLGALSAGGTFQQMFPLTPALRATALTLSPVDIIWQGFTIDGSLTEVKASGCVSQHL